MACLDAEALPEFAARDPAIILALAAATIQPVWGRAPAVGFLGLIDLGPGEVQECAEKPENQQNPQVLGLCQSRVTPPGTCCGMLALLRDCIVSGITVYTRIKSIPLVFCWTPGMSHRETTCGWPSPFIGGRVIE